MKYTTILPIFATFFNVAIAQNFLVRVDFWLNTNDTPCDEGDHYYIAVEQEQDSQRTCVNVYDTIFNSTNQSPHDIDINVYGDIWTSYEIQRQYTSGFDDSPSFGTIYAFNDYDCNFDNFTETIYGPSASIAEEDLCFVKTTGDPTITYGVKYFINDNVSDDTIFGKLVKVEAEKITTVIQTTTDVLTTTETQTETDILTATQTIIETEFDIPLDAKCIDLPFGVTLPECNSAHYNSPVFFITITMLLINFILL